MLPTSAGFVPLQGWHLSRVHKNIDFGCLLCILHVVKSFYGGSIELLDDVIFLCVVVLHGLPCCLMILFLFPLE